ncbi:MAG: hypothetical protein ABA06_01160 [Parcubacteria bacterium C7867-001]|nr:MAG: hypothetical protein ABA06_01160 [Parcubacteria bacterium C7867-001]
MNTMTKNPLINALAGLLYIAIIASFLFYVPERLQIEETVLIPILILSIFVFSAAMMGYLFLYEPLRLFLEDKKKESVSLFMKTLLAFAVSTALLVALGLYLS